MWITQIKDNLKDPGGKRVKRKGQVVLPNILPPRKRKEDGKAWAQIFINPTPESFDLVENWTNKTEIDETVNYSVGLHCHPLKTPLLASDSSCRGKMLRKQ